MIMTTILAILCSVATFELSKKQSITPVLSSSIMGCTSYFLANYFESPDLAPYMFGASFVGMTSSKVMNGFQVSISTLIYLVVLLILKDHVNGIGGLLGMSAFLGVVVGKLGFNCLKELSLRF